MFNKLRTVIYHVADLQAAKAWYQKVTGIAPYFDEPFYVGFDINGCELGLDPDLTGVIEGNHAVAYWHVDDLKKSFSTILQEGATVVSDIANVGGDTFVAVVADPFGNHIGLIAGA